MNDMCIALGEAVIATRYGEFRLIAYESEVDGGESHVALVRGELEEGAEPVLVRMHAHCVMGDVFGSTGVRLPFHARGLHASDRARGTRRAYLPASDFQGVFRRTYGRKNSVDLPS